MNLPRWFLTAMVLMLFGGLGCSDDEEPLKPPPEATLSGLVTDADGSPLAGAFINLEYTILVGDDIVYSPQSPSTIVCDSTVTMEVFDHRGRPIRTLGIEDDCIWDGLDSNGDFVPDGPYRLHVSTDEISMERWMVLVHSLSGRARTFVTTTGTDGRYRLDLADLPIWKSYPGPTEGEFTGDYSFGTGIAVYAFRGDGTTNHGRELIQIGSPTIPVTANLTIP